MVVFELYDCLPVHLAPELLVAVSARPTKLKDEIVNIFVLSLLVTSLSQKPIRASFRSPGCSLIQDGRRA